MNRVDSTRPRNIFRASGRIALFAPVVIAVLIMLPRLLSPQFELFDDGRSLTSAEKISHGIWYTYPDSFEGRFRPIHWLWFTLSYLIGGKNPFWFYLSNTLALVVIVGGLIFLVRRLGGSRLQAFTAGFAFVVAGPVVESFYTLKGEVIQLALMLLSLLAIQPYAEVKKDWHKIGVACLTLAVVFMAYLAKETSLVLLPISLVWYLLARFWPGYEADPSRRAARGIYLLANLISAPVFLVLRQLATSTGLNQGSYTVRYAFQLGQIAVSALRWAGWLVRDFAWVVPLLVLAILFILRRRTLANRSLLVDALVWMGAWIGVYLPWNFMAEYYMLPFALGLAVFVSALAAEILPAFREAGWKRWAAMAGSILAAVLLIGSLLNNLTNARVQLTVDAADAAMMEYLIRNTGTGSTILVNIQDPNEYYYEMGSQLAEIDGRPDLNLQPFRSNAGLPGDKANLFIVTPYVKNQPLLTVRMGVIEDTQNHWNDNLLGFLQTDPGWRIVSSPSGDFTLTDVNYPRVFCALVKTRSFCATPAPLIDTRQFSYGWRIYQSSGP